MMLGECCCVNTPQAAITTTVLDNFNTGTSRSAGVPDETGNNVWSGGGHNSVFPVANGEVFLIGDAVQQDIEVYDTMSVFSLWGGAAPFFGLYDSFTSEFDYRIPSNFIGTYDSLNPRTWHMFGIRDFSSPQSPLLAVYMRQTAVDEYSLGCLYTYNGNPIFVFSETIFATGLQANTVYNIVFEKKDDEMYFYVDGVFQANITLPADYDNSPSHTPAQQLYLAGLESYISRFRFSEGDAPVYDVGETNFTPSSGALTALT